MTTLKDIVNKKIVAIYSNADCNGIGNKVILLLEDGIGISINSYKGSYFKYSSADCFDSYRRILFNNSSSEVFVESISTVAGVHTYIKLSCDCFIRMYEEVENMEMDRFYYSIEVVCNTKDNQEEYKEFIEDLTVAEEMEFDKI